MVCTRSNTPFIRQARLGTRERTRLGAALVLAIACLLSLCACAPAAGHDASLRLFDSGERLSDTERVVSAGALPANSYLSSTADDEVTEFAATFYVPATIASDAVPDSVAYAAVGEDITLKRESGVANDSRISLSDTLDNPVMQLLYWLQTMAEAPDDESGKTVTASGDEATDLFALSMTVAANPDSLAAINESFSAEGSDPEALLACGKRAVASQLSGSTLSFTATYNDGTEVTRTYTIAVHEVNDDGMPVSYVLACA